MKIERLIVTPLEVNCYIVWDEESLDAAVIDPGGDGEYIITTVNNLGVNPVCIINTHGHVDHVGANADVKAAFPDAQLMIHELDLVLLRNVLNSFIAPMVGAKESPEPDVLLREGDVITVGSISLVVLHTPGHTPGSVCLYSKENRVVFTGDTLFAGSVGRVDLPYSEPEKLIPSIQRKLMVLPDDTLVLPGHGPESTIGRERIANPFVTGAILL